MNQKEREEQIDYLLLKIENIHLKEKLIYTKLLTDWHNCNANKEVHTNAPTFTNITPNNAPLEYILTYNKSKNNIKINEHIIHPKCEYLTKSHYKYLINICKLNKETYTLEEIGGITVPSYSQISKLNKAFCNLLESLDIPPKKLLFSTRDKSGTYYIPFFNIKVIS